MTLIGIRGIIVVLHPLEGNIAGPQLMYSKYVLLYNFNCFDISLQWLQMKIHVETFETIKNLILSFVLCI